MDEHKSVADWLAALRNEELPTAALERFLKTNEELLNSLSPNNPEDRQYITYAIRHPETHKRIVEKTARLEQELSPEEFVARMEADIEKAQAEIKELEQQRDDWEAVVRVSAAYKTLGEAIESIRSKQQRSQAEAEALDAFERLDKKARQRAVLLAETLFEAAAEAGRPMSRLDPWNHTISVFKAHPLSWWI
jgi:hypothetical protein